MKLYTFPPSPNARKVAAVIAHLQLTDIEHALIRLQNGEHRQPDYLAINPMGKVPALRDGDLLLWEFECDLPIPGRSRRRRIVFPGGFQKPRQHRTLAVLGSRNRGRR